MQEVRESGSRVVLVEGEAGIGKTALIDHFAAEVEDARVIRASGEQAETAVAYGLVDQLLRATSALGDGVFEPGHPGGQAADHVTIGIRLLQAVGSLEESGPVLVAVDDAHWADAASLRALLFVARRFVSERVLLLIAVREPERGNLPEGLRRLAGGAGGQVVRLGPLQVGELEELAAGEGVDLPSRAASRLHAHTSGNPLHALALLRELPHDAWQEPGLSLTVPRSFAETVVAKLTECSAATRRLVEAAAVLGARPPFAAAVELAAVDEPFDALEQAVSARLLVATEESDEHELTFPHPLVERAVYRQIGPARRARLHREAARLADDRAIAFRHLVAAAAGPDPRLADELERFAAGEAARAAWSGVAWALAAAGRLSDSRGAREPRLLAAAEAALYAGSIEHARRLTERVGDPANGALRDRVVAYIEMCGPRASEAQALLERAWKLTDDQVDAGTASRIAMTMALLRLMGLRGADAATWAQRAVELTAPDITGKAPEKMMVALGLMHAGRLGEAEELARAMLAENPDESELKAALGWVLLAREDFARAAPQLAAAASAARRAGSLEVAAMAHGLLSRVEFLRGRWDAALIQSERALALIGELPHLVTRPVVRWTASFVPAARGDWATADELAAHAAGDAPGMLDRSMAAAIARALPAAARGDHATVLAAFSPLLDATAAADGANQPGVSPWHDIYGEALVAAGRLDEARAFLQPHEEHAAALGLFATLARLRRVRGQLEAAADDTQTAATVLEAAIADADRAGASFDRARAQLVYGGILRRQRRRRDAAEQLRPARTVLAALGAGPYLERCERELAACGLTPVKRGANDPSRLTPQERSVAELVAAGMTNREVAAELLVSVKTVEVHLTRIYSKLGVRSRAQLAARAQDERERPTGGDGSGAAAARSGRVDQSHRRSE